MIIFAPEKEGDLPLINGRYAKEVHITRDSVRVVDLEGNHLIAKSGQLVPDDKQEVPLAAELGSSRLALDIAKFLEIDGGDE